MYSRTHENVGYQCGKFCWYAALGSMTAYLSSMFHFSFNYITSFNKSDDVSIENAHKGDQ